MLYKVNVILFPNVPVISADCFESGAVPGTASGVLRLFNSGSSSTCGLYALGGHFFSGVGPNNYWYLWINAH